MNRRLFSFIVCVSLAAPAIRIPARAAAPPPLEAFASPVQMSEPDMSPDGHHVVFIDRSETQANVAVMDVDTGRTSRVLGGQPNGYKVSRCEFKNDTRILCHFLATVTAHGNATFASRMVAVNIDRSELKVLTQYGNASLSQDQTIDLLRDDPRHVLVQQYEEHAGYPSVFKMDVYTSQLERVVKGVAPIIRWQTDRAGVVRFGWGFTDVGSFYRARDSEAAPWRILHPKESFDGGEFRVFGFGVQPDKVIVAAPRNGRTAVWEMDLTDNSDRQLLFSLPRFNVGGPVNWPSDGRLVGFAYNAEKPQLELFDEQARVVQSSLDKLLPDTTSRVIAGSRNGQRLIVASSSDRQPMRFFMLDLQAKSMRLLRRDAPQLTAETLAEMKVVNVPGADGVQIPAYLTLPVGAEPKNLPTIVLPHGEQFGRDVWGFDAMTQMLASRGYAVLRVNYRGTAGFGFDWLQAGYKNAGSLMVSDVTASTRWLIAQGIADPKRVCVVGWNVAGYASLLSAIRDGTLYQCVVSIGGITDLKMQNWDRRYFYFGDRISMPLKDETGDEASPVKHAAQLKLPVLLIHGTADLFVPIEQSEAMARALQSSGNPAKLLRIEGGDHLLSEPQDRLTLFRELEAFLAKHLAAH